MIRMRLIAATWSALLMGTALAQSEAVQVKRQAELRQQPSETSNSVATLPAMTNIVRLPERQGPWMHVKTDSGQIGWVHMFDIGSVQAQSAAGGTAAGALRGITNFFNRGSAQTTTTATSTVGIRGLGSEDIANAQPNLDALKKAESMRTDEAQAKRFASESQLVARNVESLPAPNAPPPQNASEANGNLKQGGK
jgi:hypothetical protein